MSAPYTARCVCGAVTATIRGEPLAVKLCYCRQCQQIAAGGPTANAVFRADDIDLVGELAAHAYTAASGERPSQHFCPCCGTHVFGQSPAAAQFRAVRLGFLDPGHGLKPDGAIWVEEAPEWAVFDPQMPGLARQTPPAAED